jgi:hypothetical protein
LEDDVTEHNSGGASVRFCPHQTSVVFWLVPTAKFLQTVIMEMKRKNLALIMKLDIIHVCEVGSLSKNGIGMQYGLILQHCS